MMSFHYMLVDLQIPYFSEETVEPSDEVIEFIHERSSAASQQLAD
jgi:ribonucleotide reductase alpha subunit